MFRKTHFLTVAVGALVLALPSTLLAAKGNKAARRHQAAPTARLLKRYDTNGNGSIDGEEVVALRKTFDLFKGLDKDGNGTLDDSEIAAIKVADKAGAKGAKRERRKKHV
jgi:Ca2+-binding EF-hand superfamily protein